MNRTIIALKEMINNSENTQRLRASLQHRTLGSIHRVLLALLLITTGAGSAWALEPTYSVWNGTVPAKPADAKTATVNNAGIEGAGTSENPFLIKNADNFVFFWAAACNGLISSSTQYWRLDANIDLGSHAWTHFDKNGTFKGKFDGNGKIIKNMSITINAANKNFGLFPQVQGVSATSHAEIKNLTIKDFSISTPNKNTSYGATTNTGFLVGKINGNVDIENVTVSGGTIAYDVTTTDGNYVGCLAGQITSDNNIVTGCTVNGGAAITTASGADAAKKKNFYVGGLAGNVGNNTLIKGNTVTIQITLNGETSGNNFAGGLLGYASGSNSTTTAELPMGKRVVVQGNTVTPTITMNGVVTSATFSIGGFLGYINNHVNVFNNKVINPAISVTNDIKNSSYVGGAIGYLNNWSYVDGMTVSGGSITGPASSKTVTNNITFYVGGFLGYQNSSGTDINKPNKFMNIAVTGININLENYIPGGAINNHKFAVGGIAGSVNAPNRDANGFCGMPENLIAKSVMIYAPWAATSPTVPNFNAVTSAHDRMTLEQVSTVDALEKAKVKTWYYNDYKLGLSQRFLDCGKVKDNGTSPAVDTYRKNYTATPGTEDGISYLAIDNTTFKKQNRFQDSERDSWTVLWWTCQATMDYTKATPTVVSPNLFTNEEQPIYPQSGASYAQANYKNLSDYPYYMYFYQGVANATYVTSEVAAKIIEGIEANKTQAAEEHPITLVISNNKETERGFAQRTITVAAKTTDSEGNEIAASGLTYQWYLNGVAHSTATSINLTPHWKDGQGLTVNALSGATVVATATYTLAPGVLHTKASFENATAEQIRSDVNKRGTSSNPYIIDCERALRQLSYLSTSNTYTRWEDIAMPIDPSTNKASNLVALHYNRAYYELGADVTMSADAFIPISHVGYGSDGTWGTYTNNFIFQGNFDGKGKKISNLHITWGAGQYNGNGTNIYHGLFGAIGHSAATAKWGDGTATSQTIVKNLVIDGAVLTHDVNNTTFSYKKNYAHITANNFNNCMVGVLAGVVNNNTTIQNIEIRNSSITDASTTNDYKLATLGLYVGGAIGSVQYAYNTTTTVPLNIVIDHIAAQVDITLTHPKFESETPVKEQYNQFNIGGIIGRFITTSATKDQAQGIMPKYTLYSGLINARKAWISPVLGALRYKDQNSNDFKNFSRQWEGNNNTAVTQITITNAQYYNFYIEAKNDGTKVSDTYPTNKCDLGARSVTIHTNGSESTTYVATNYQGVNYNAQPIPEARASLELLNRERTGGYSWVWDNDGTFVHMTTDRYVELSLDRDALINNKFTASLEGATTASDAYKWYVRINDTWHEIVGVTSNEYTVPVSLKPKYVKATATVDGNTYTTLVEMVDADDELCKPSITKGGTDDNPEFTFNMNQKETLPAPTFTTTYQWYSKKDVEIADATNNTLQLTKSALENYNKIVWCKAVVKELGEEVAEFFIINGATVIYVNGNNYAENGAATGNDSNDGLSPGKPVLTLAHAYDLLKTETDGGDWDNNIIVIMGSLDNAGLRSKGTKPATLTGVWNGTDYEGVITIKKYDSDDVNKPSDPKNCYISADTKFENLTFYGSGNADGDDNNFIECHGHDVWFGKGLKMDHFRNLGDDHGNLLNAQNIPELTIILTATNLTAEAINTMTTRTKPQVVTFESGHYGRLMGGRFTNGFFSKAENTSHTILGSKTNPVWAIVNVNIDKNNQNVGTVNRTKDPNKGLVTDNYTLDINCIIAGLTDGNMFGDYQINVHGGRIGYIVGGNQGNPVPNGGNLGNSTISYNTIGGTINGKWGQWPNATYFGRTVVNIEQWDETKYKPIIIDNVYAGGLGRKANGSKATSVVDMFFYGKTEVNIKSGKVLGGVYAGGAGGVLGLSPWDVHVPYDATDVDDDAAKAISNGVQYGDTGVGTGAWSTKTPGSALASVTLHELNEDGTFKLTPVGGYIEETYNLGQSSTTVNISGGTINGSVYGGGYGYVANMPYQVTMQGVGSVFGTTNVNISGGEINGSVYGGSQGSSEYYNQVNKYGQTINHIAEMVGTVNMNITGRPTINGNIFGGGQGLPTVGGEEYLRIATTGNTDLAGNEASEEQKAKYRTNINITIDIDNEFNGNIFGGGQMGMVDGNTNVVINKGTINGDVYGGGMGERGHLDKAAVNGKTKVTLGN